MVKQICQLLRTRYDRHTLTIRIPECFDQLKGEEENFEMVTSPTLKTTHLCYNHNIVGDSIAFIFVNDECNRFSGMDDEQKKAQWRQGLIEEENDFSSVS